MGKPQRGVPGSQFHHQGQAAVEFLIVVPVLLLLILGTIQFALIYHAKTTLNYAAFETARAGALNNARLWAMEHAFTRTMGAMYTNGYRELQSDGSCSSDFAVYAGAAAADLELDHAKCGRELVRQMVNDGWVRILLINPSDQSFTDYGTVDFSGDIVIPNDNLMYRDDTARGATSANEQSIQDANLLKVHVSMCYELLVPLVNRLLARMMTNAASADEPENFGPLQGGSFGADCAGDASRYGIPLYAQSVMRMQSEATQNFTYTSVSGYRCAGAC